MVEKPLVSVIIPTYNRAHLIGETLNSVLAQTYQNWECIIVDDGSTDNTDEVVGEYVKKDSRFKYYHRHYEHLQGGNGARNYGFKMSQGEYVNWFDSDDLMHPQKIELKINVLKEYDVDFVVCFGLIVDDNKNEIARWNNIYMEKPLFNHIVGKVSFQTNGPLFKRSLIENSGLFNEKLKRKQDWEYFSRILTYSEDYYPLKKYLFTQKYQGYGLKNKNKITLINSKVLADILVYNQVKKERRSIIDIDLRHHFLRKFIYNFRVSRKFHQYKALFYSLYGIMLVSDINLTKRILKKII